MVHTAHSRNALIILSSAALWLTFAERSAAGDRESSYASEVPAHVVVVDKTGSTLATDGTIGSIPVAEELDYVRENAFHKPSDESLKQTSDIDYRGTRYVGCAHYALTIHAARPNHLHLKLTSDDGDAFEIDSADLGMKFQGEPNGLDIVEQRALLQLFEFDTPQIGLEADMHSYKPLGMQKVGTTLTWKLQADASGGFRKILYVDSHFGDVVKYSILNIRGETLIHVVQHDFRTVDGVRVPFAIDYLNPAGQIIVSDRIERAVVTPRPT